MTHETAKDLSDDDGYLHSDDEGITDLPLASSLVEHALDALVEQVRLLQKLGEDPMCERERTSPRKRQRAEMDDIDIALLHELGETY